MPCKCNATEQPNLPLTTEHPTSVETLPIGETEIRKTNSSNAEWAQTENLASPVR